MTNNLRWVCKLLWCIYRMGLTWIKIWAVRLRSNTWTCLATPVKVINKMKSRVNKILFIYFHSEVIIRSNPVYAGCHVCVPPCPSTLYAGCHVCVPPCPSTHLLSRMVWSHGSHPGASSPRAWQHIHLNTPKNINWTLIENLDTQTYHYCQWGAIVDFFCTPSSHLKIFLFHSLPMLDANLSHPVSASRKNLHFPSHEN